MDSQSEASRSTKLQGPRPGPLMVNEISRKMMKKEHVAGKKQCSSPVVIYLRSPEVFRVKPEEFMSLVQQLTGNPNPPSSTSCETLHRSESETDAGAVDVDVDEIGQLEHFRCTSRVGPTDFHTSMHFVDFV